MFFLEQLISMRERRSNEKMHTLKCCIKDVYTFSDLI